MVKVPKHISDKQLEAEEARKDRRAQYFLGACTLLGPMLSTLLPLLLDFLKQALQ